ncbi:hypothetical protein CAPTEDRAFT_22628, partial [Capitella teleta]
NCTPPAIEKFPRVGIFDQPTRREGAVVIHILLALYMFLGLAIVCDDYFVPACEAICEALSLQDDVAGATFMAAGSSAPELATTIIGVFITKDDIALGAVVGSAVFNVMLVPGLCAVYALTVIYLRWWPLFRDCVFYTLSIIALVLSIYDEVIQWYEALALICLYVVYILIMIFNPAIDAWMTSRCTCFPLPPGAEATSLSIKDANNVSIVLPFSSAGFVSSFNDLIDPADETEFHTLMDSKPDARTIEADGLYEGRIGLANGQMYLYLYHFYRKQIRKLYRFAVSPPFKVDIGDDPDPPCVVPAGCWKRFTWVMGLPLTVALYITVPDCRRDRFRRLFVLSFLLSVVWIGVFSYVMVWMITVVGQTLSVPDTVMGLTFIAAGSSVPDAIASLIVIREGHGDMAISNAVGSNVFDILLCLGCPWLIQTTLGDSRHGIPVYSHGLTYSALTLLSTVVFLLVATHLNGWRLTKMYGILLIVMYALFNVLASCYELNLFGVVHPPTCPSD